MKARQEAGGATTSQNEAGAEVNQEIIDLHAPNISIAKECREIPDY